MRTLTMLVALVALSGTAFAAERRPHVAKDECARRSAVCEQGCDEKVGMDRLTCKTDCRQVETQCRNGKKVERSAEAR